MGLNTTHNCWHGPYSSFNAFRFALARQIGINLDEYDGYNSKGTKDLETIEHDLQPLFNHSDCDGDLKVEESVQIVKGLNNVLDNFNEELQMPTNFKENIIQFRDGCLEAIHNNEIIKFH